MIHYTTWNNIAIVVSTVVQQYNMRYMPSCNTNDDNEQKYTKENYKWKKNKKGN